MVDNVWLVDAIKDISEFAREEEIDGVLAGLSHVLETYAFEMGLTEKQHGEICEMLSLDAPETSRPRGQEATSL